MKAKIYANNVNPFSSVNTYKFIADLPDKCPCCETAYASSPCCTQCVENDDGIVIAYSIFFCPTCGECFFTCYDVVETTTNYVGVLRATYPYPNAKTSFSSSINSLSPSFVKIYNQDEQAEASGLDEIAGLGYRKALEFLIKDYAIHEYPDESESIKSKPLAQCIKNYISADNLKTLAERSTWIGNDEAHYIRKQEDRDVSDMKSFIQAIVYFIGMILITEDATSMTPKK